MRLKARSSPDDQHQSEGGDKLAEPEWRPWSRMMGKRKQRQRKHDIGARRAEKTPADLRSHVEAGISPRQPAQKYLSYRHHRIQMSARYRPESENQCGECGRCGNRVGEESQSHIAPGKTVTHDAGAHDG